MLALASTIVIWSALGQEALVALIGGVGVVAAFGLCLLGLNARNRAREQSGAAMSVAGVAMLTLGAAVCVAALVIGFIAMTHKSS
jgi:hypothetical protein